MQSSVNAQISQPRPRKIVRFVSLVAAVLLTIGILSMFGNTRPENLGVRDGLLAACPASPNCVSTSAEREQQRIEPLVLTSTDVEELTDVVERIIRETSRWKAVERQPGYWHIECTSLICRFVDDLEVWLDTDSQLVHVRSASRVGYSDMGVNRKRVEMLFEKLVASNVASKR